ncbi:SemiSWEET family sugar transporter [Nitrososphaera viennensis]|uniref:SemiSWEET family transporter n=2 Tax=Nitrososphaera viennensis TaxID=1034015 RepID=A0A977NPC6_9ARCH|nr:SemiSWEET family transporter [Nitrososphaera viennensis]AIC17110.1 putative MtN3 (Sweet) Family transporter [Nitrososphaera viennensis EN76]UVS70655.1 SemiSWEET family transporter [Nitrososphaera viennensis]
MAGFLTPGGQWAVVLLPLLPPQALLLQVISDGIFITLIGSAAACLTTSSFLPQIFKGYMTKKMQDVSPYLMALYASGTTLWLAYGIFKDDWVIIGANALGTAFNLLLLYMKRIYRRPSSSLAA